MATVSDNYSSSSVYVSLGLCQLNQWAMDFEGNLEKIMLSVQEVKSRGGRYRLGPELEICGYSCDDHFNEPETVGLCWQSLTKILKSDLSEDCLVDVGMPVEYKSVRYNCRVFILNHEIILIRPKMFLACDGSYRENRWFGTWNRAAGLEEYILPQQVRDICTQRTCPFGFAAVQCNDCLLASETCEEMFVPHSPHLPMCLAGVDIFTNGSASYFQLDKLKRRFELIMGPTAKMGGIYLYCNSTGNDGGSFGFDGSSFIACNGDLVSMTPTNSLQDVTVLVEHINVTRVRAFRSSNASYAYQASGKFIPTVKADIWLSGKSDSTLRMLNTLLNDKPGINQLENLPSVSEDLISKCALWVWDYLRRSHTPGFILLLSNDLISAACGTVIRWMCEMLAKSMRDDPSEKNRVTREVENILKMRRSNPKFPTNGEQLCKNILFTVWIGKGKSNEDMKNLQTAKNISNQIGSTHIDSQDTSISSQLISRFEDTYGKMFDESDEFYEEMWIRGRIDLSYVLAKIIPKNELSQKHNGDDQINSSDDKRFRNPHTSHFICTQSLIVLASSCLDQALTGNFTKCPGGDISPIGSISSANIRRMVQFASRKLNSPILNDLAIQKTKERRSGLIPAEIYLFGALRKIDLTGPVEMFERLVQLWRKNKMNITEDHHASISTMDSSGGDGQNQSTMNIESPLNTYGDAVMTFVNQPDLTVEKIAAKVKMFFETYSVNRHKVNALPPSLHVEGFDCEPGRFDWRPFNYPAWTIQFAQIDKLVAQTK